MKKICLSLLLIFTFITLCSCNISDNSADDERRYSCEAIPEGIYYLCEDITDMYPYDNRFYGVSYYSGDVGYRDTNNSEYKILYNVGENAASDIYVDNTGIYTNGDHSVYYINFDGSLKNKIELPEIEASSNGYGVAANGKYIVCSYYYYAEKDKSWKNIIYVIDKDTNILLSHDFDKSKDKSETIGKIISTSQEKEFILIGTEQLYSFDVSNGKTEVLYSGANSFSDDYSKSVNCLYFVDTSLTSGQIKLGKTQLPEGEKSVTRSTDIEYIFPKIKSCVEGAGKTAREYYFNETFYTESGYVIFESGNSTACVISEKLNETGEKITVVYRCSPTTEEESRSDFEIEFGSMNGVMSRMNTQFEEENKIAVNAKGYAYDKFVENLRIKLLAGDDDYDVVMLEHADELLASILNYGLYLPLETYESISSGFDKYYDGVRDVMSYDGHIYGIPYYLTAYGFTSETDTKDTLDKLSYDYTIDGFWNLCEELGSTRIMFCTELTNKKPFYYIISSIIEDGMRKGEISRDTLLECIETYMKYREAGSLNLNIPGNGPLRIIGGIGGTLDAKFEEREYKTLRSLPSYDGKRYIDVKSMAYINSKTKNSDLAAEYLSMLVSDDYLPWCSNYDKSYLAKDVNSYFYLSYGEDELATEYKKIKVPAGENDYMSECNAFLVENGENLFTNAAPRIYTGCLEDMINEVYNGLNDGKLTAEEAADKIYSEASYQLME